MDKNPPPSVDYKIHEENFSLFVGLAKLNLVAMPGILKNQKPKWKTVGWDNE